MKREHAKACYRLLSAEMLYPYKLFLRIVAQPITVSTLVAVMAGGCNSNTANLPDGEFIAWEVSAKVANGRVIECGNKFMEKDLAQGGCMDWIFVRSNRNHDEVILGRKDNNVPIAFCKKTKPSHRGMTCTSKGWAAELTP